MRICQDSFQDTSTPTRIIWIKTDIDTVGICQPNYIAARCDWPPVNFTTSVFLQVLVKSVAINIFINLCPGHRLSNPVLEVEGRCANLAPRLPQAQQAIAPISDGDKRALVTIRVQPSPLGYFDYPRRGRWAC